MNGKNGSGIRGGLRSIAAAELRPRLSDKAYLPGDHVRPGSNSDATACFAGATLSEELKVAVVVHNTHGGGGGMIAFSRPLSRPTDRL